MTTVHRGRKGVAAGVIAIVGILAALGVQLRADDGRTQVPDELVRDPAYTQYAVMLIQLDLLSNPLTADLPVSVVSSEPGMIFLSGTVPDERSRRYLIANAERISGLNVQGNVQVGSIEAKFQVSQTTEKLEYMTSETLASLFPELVDDVRTTVTSDGTIVLTGDIGSYESKTMLSQAVKSQPGCKAVANLLHVPADPESGYLTISEDGRLRLKANAIPSIPPAPLLDPEEPQDFTPPSRSRMNPRTIVADDAPEAGPQKRQLVEDAQAALAAAPELADVRFEVDAEGSTVVLRGVVPGRRVAESAVRTMLDVPGVKKIVAQTSPVGIQRNVLASDDRALLTVEPKKLLGFIPLGRKSERRPEESRAFRESVKKTLQDLCGDLLEDLEIRSSLEGLMIEGVVPAGRDRNFVFRQVDNIIELRTVPYTVVIRVKD